MARYTQNQDKAMNKISEQLWKITVVEGGVFGGNTLLENVLKRSVANKEPARKIYAPCTGKCCPRVFTATRNF